MEVPPVQRSHKDLPTRPGIPTLMQRSFPFTSALGPSADTVEVRAVGPETERGPDVPSRVPPYPGQVPATPSDDSVVATTLTDGVGPGVSTTVLGPLTSEYSLRDPFPSDRKSARPMTPLSVETHTAVIILGTATRLLVADLRLDWGTFIPPKSVWVDGRECRVVAARYTGPCTFFHTSSSRELACLV